jgi:hypothetical protein
MRPWSPPWCEPFHWPCRLSTPPPKSCFARPRSSHLSSARKRQVVDFALTPRAAATARCLAHERETSWNANSWARLGTRHVREASTKLPLSVMRTADGRSRTSMRVVVLRRWCDLALHPLGVQPCSNARAIHVQARPFARSERVRRRWHHDDRAPLMTSRRGPVGCPFKAAVETEPDVRGPHSYGAANAAARTGSSLDYDPTIHQRSPPSCMSAYALTNWPKAWCRPPSAQWIDTIRGTPVIWRTVGRAPARLCLAFSCAATPPRKWVRRTRHSDAKGWWRACDSRAA